MHTAQVFDYQKAFSRNEGLISKEEQLRLKFARIAIPGMGGVGGVHLTTLLRMGVSKFHIADADQFSLVNFNRQYGANLSTVGKNKTEVMSAVARDINPEAEINVWNEWIDEYNVEAFLFGCDLVLDGIDAFNVEARRIVFMKARQMGIPVITAGPVGFSSAMLIFTPDSMSFEDYFDIRKGMTDQDQLARFAAGITPLPHYLSYLDTQKADFEQKHGPCVASAVMLCAGFVATEAVKILLGRKKVYATPYYHYFDPYLMKFKRKYLFFGNRDLIQRIKIYWMKKLILKRSGKQA